VEIPCGPCPVPRRERRATCDEDDGVASVSLLTGRAFAFSASPSPVGVRMKLPAALQQLQQLFTASGTGCGLAFGGADDARRCSQEEGKEEGKEPPPGRMSAARPQGELYDQASPLALRVSTRSRLTD